MRILLVKTSSLGDVIHTFPAVSDLQKVCPRFVVDWVVEPSFAEIPKWHPFVGDVITVDMRRWRKNLFSPKTWNEWGQFVDRLHRYEYDIVIDAQGLMKSALITRKARGKKCGLNWRSAWEPLASLFYDQSYSVDPKLHAIHRMQSLFSEIFDYHADFDNINYGINLESLTQETDIPDKPYFVFVHATTWESKHWPITYWQQLTKKATKEGLVVLLPWGNEQEKKQAELIAQDCELAQVLPKMNLTQVAGILAKSAGVVAVDTGLAHISAALNVPLISLYGPTDPTQTGTLGKNCTVISADFACAPCSKPTCHYQGQSIVKPACFADITPERVWQLLEKFREEGNLIEHFDNSDNVQPA